MRFSVCLTALFFSVLIGFAIAAPYEIDENCVWPWGTEKYTVQRGETFASIAKECCVPVDFLKKLNGDIKDYDSIRQGDIVEIPSLCLDQLAHVFMSVNENYDMFDENENWNRPVGVLGILPSTVDEVNRLAGYNKFGYDARKSMSDSIEMFKIIMSHPTKVQTPREAVKRWKPKVNVD